MIDIRNICFGGIEKKGNRRELTLISADKRDDIGYIIYDTIKGTAKGYLKEYNISIAKDADCFTATMGKYVFEGNLRRSIKWSRLRILSKTSGEKSDFFLSSDLPELCVKIAYSKKNNLLLKINVSINQTLFVILRALLSIFLLGLYRPALKSILCSKKARLSNEENLRCFIAAVTLQLIYYPQDYEDWT